MSHKFGVTESENLGDALIHCADFAVQRNRKNQMIETIDQVAVTLAGIRNNFSKPFQLFSAGRRILHLLDSAGIAPQFVDFPLLAPNVDSKQDDENAHPYWERFEVQWAALQSLVGQDGNANGKDRQHQNRQAPHIIFLAFEPVEFLRRLSRFLIASGHRSFPRSIWKGETEENREPP